MENQNRNFGFFYPKINDGTLEIWVGGDNAQPRRFKFKSNKGVFFDYFSFTLSRWINSFPDYLIEFKDGIFIPYLENGKPVIKYLDFLMDEEHTTLKINQYTDKYFQFKQYVDKVGINDYLLTLRYNKETDDILLEFISPEGEVKHSLPVSYMDTDYVDYTTIWVGDTPNYNLIMAVVVNKYDDYKHIGIAVDTKQEGIKTLIKFGEINEKNDDDVKFVLKEDFYVVYSDKNNFGVGWGLDTPNPKFLDYNTLSKILKTLPKGYPEELKFSRSGVVINYINSINNEREFYYITPNHKVKHLKWVKNLENKFGQIFHIFPTDDGNFLVVGDTHLILTDNKGKVIDKLEKSTIQPLGATVGDTDINHTLRQSLYVEGKFPNYRIVSLIHTQKVGGIHHSNQNKFSIQVVPYPQLEGENTNLQHYFQNLNKILLNGYYTTIGKTTILNKYYYAISRFYQSPFQNLDKSKFQVVGIKPLNPELELEGNTLDGNFLINKVGDTPNHKHSYIHLINLDNQMHSVIVNSHIVKVNVC